MGFFRALKRKNKQSHATCRQNLNSSSADGGPAADGQQRKGGKGMSDKGARRKRRSPSRNSSKQSSQQKNPLDHLRNLSAKLLEEQSNATTTLHDSDDSQGTAHLLVEVVASSEEIGSASLNLSKESVPLQNLESWLEPSPILQPADSMTDPACCSALEMLSFDTLCGGRFMMKSLDEHILLAIRPRPAARDASISEPYGIPCEISFERRSSRQRTNNFREEMEIMEHDNGPTSFLRGLRGFKSNKRKTTAKVKVYCEKPLPMNHTNSATDSTITWPAEFLRNGIDVTDEHQL